MPALFRPLASADNHPRRARAQPADDCGMGKPFMVQALDDALRRIAATGDQQAAAGLRVGQQVELPLGQVRRQLHFVAIALPVLFGCTGDETLLDRKSVV